MSDTPKPVSENTQNKQNKQNTPKEIQTPNTSVQGLSQVSKESSSTKLYMWIAAGIIVVVVIFFMVLPSSGKKEGNKNDQGLNPDTQSLLEANEARLRGVQSTPALSMSISGQSREDKARQNAPTTMYAASPSGVGMIGLENKGVQEATFAGSGGMAEFGNQSIQTSSVSATSIAHPDYTIVAGEFIQAVLETAVNSDLPGMVRAVITRPVYAYVGESPLIPAGSRLIGQYSSAVLQGQNRIMVMWNRVVLPNGIAIQINSPGNDAIGMAGQGADDVNTHFWARFGEASLLSLIGAGVSTQGVSGKDQDNSEAQYRTAIAQSFQQSASSSLNALMPIKPTLMVDQGAEINVFVAHDLSFYQVLKNRVRQEVSISP